MDFGIFARTFPSAGLEEHLDVLENSGVRLIHYNLACAGLETLPEEIPATRVREIRLGFELRDLSMVALSGTFNAIHPDVEKRREWIRRAILLIEEAPSLGASAVTLCTGTRDPENMWRAHPENSSLEAWRDLLETLGGLLPRAEECGVYLGIEPESGNVVDSAVKARTLLDEVKSPAMKIVLDGANLISPGDLGSMTRLLEEAVDLLAGDLIMAHAKDIPKSPGESQAAGRGLLDWETYFGALQRVGFDGPVILHNLTPEEVRASLAFVKSVWDARLASED